MNLTSLEICGGAGGQALGLEQAGWEHAAVVDNDPDSCATLRHNRPGWKVVEQDLRELDGRQYRGIDLLCGGVPCQPFSVGGLQLGEADERNLFPEALRLIREARPKAIMLENVKGLGGPRFDGFRFDVLTELHSMDYFCDWRLELASAHGVPQLRPRMVLIGLQAPGYYDFRWPAEVITPTTAGLALYDLMKANGWPGAAHWALERCNTIAPTLVGGSRKHGGPDLGPTRARAAWAKLGVNGGSVAEQAPGPLHPLDFMPRLTPRMMARLQGFPDSWEFIGGKTSVCRQIGNAFPPPVARDMGDAIREALSGG
jgi:DNA (cytosine-5)-methyltransferase 1